MLLRLGRDSLRLPVGHSGWHTYASLSKQIPFISKTDHRFILLFHLCFLLFSQLPRKFGILLFVPLAGREAHKNNIKGVINGHWHVHFESNKKN